MRPDVVESIDVSALRQSAQWVICQDEADAGFRFSANEEPPDASGNTVCLPTGQALLSGNPFLQFSLAPCTSHQSGHFRYFQNDEILIGAGQIAVDAESLEAASYELYKEFLIYVGQRSICRIWNYVPGINETHPGLLENYKLFCSGRSLAFEAVFGEETPWHFPAASATGSNSDFLTVVFIASSSEVENWENPEQIPAYRYPPEYGPRPPAFARASRFIDSEGIEWIFISGTAAIKGFASLHKGDFDRQLEVTLENIDLVLQRCSMRLTACDSGRRRHFKAFLRNRDNLAALLRRMQTVMTPEDSFSVVEGDICRSDLEVEIELTVFPSQQSPEQ